METTPHPVAQRQFVARTGDLIARKMIEEEKIREDYARSLIRELK
jgi:hypothetical protein